MAFRQFKLLRGPCDGIFPNFHNYLKVLLVNLFHIERNCFGVAGINLAACGRRICYAHTIMIELSQPAQCLFCPQRRKIALLMKLMMAGSAAIITALLLFQPGSQRIATPRTAASPLGTVIEPAVRAATDERNFKRAAASDAVWKRSAEILGQAHERFQDVQAKMRPLLSGEISVVSGAQKLLSERQREILKTKVLTLGEGLFSESEAAEGERKRVLDALDKELALLAEQQKLLAQLKETN